VEHPSPGQGLPAVALAKAGGKMQFVNDPRKSKNVFIIMLVVSIVLFLGLAVLGYLFWQKNKSYTSLLVEKKTLESQYSLISKDTVKQIADLKTENANLKKENETLTASNKDKTTKMAKAKAYNDVLAYLIQIIQAHNGLNGWTEAEYQTGRAKAVATGDQSFIDIIDWAWNNQAIDQVERLTKVMDAMADGINSNLK